MLEIKLKIETA